MIFRLKTSMIRSSLCDYSDAYILVSGTMTVAIREGSKRNNADKEVFFKNWAPFIDCTSEITNAQIDNAIYWCIYPMRNLAQYIIDNYSKTSEVLWQYYKDKSALADASAIKNFQVGNNNSALFANKSTVIMQINNSKKTTGKTAADGRKDVDCH